MNNPIAQINIIAYTPLFQYRTFLPSKLPTGIILNTASHALIMYPYANHFIGNIKVISKNITAKIMLIIGPAAAIFPYLLLVTVPEIITPPGAANTNPNKDITIAKISILLSALNSAQQ